MKIYISLPDSKLPTVFGLSGWQVSFETEAMNESKS